VREGYEEWFGGGARLRVGRGGGGRHPTAVGCRGPRSPQRIVGGPLAVMGHSGFLANRRGARRLVAEFEKIKGSCNFAK
jgi:hypothetical protein